MKKQMLLRADSSAATESENPMQLRARGTEGGLLPPRESRIKTARPCEFKGSAVQWKKWLTCSYQQGVTHDVVASHLIRQTQANPTHGLDKEKGTMRRGVRG
ncbi:hypothetical protein CLAIMM_04203 [Cladophialophora immunda]|nr:hypothetical protein CLAIMM_04203 [Cladophialophora immunda]